MRTEASAQGCVFRGRKSELPSKQLGKLEAEWERKRHGHPKLLTPLPRRVRLRLAAERVIDHAGYWLICHGRYGATERLWRIFGMWR